MGTIAEKLTYLNDTRLEIKDGLNKFGADLTENDTFRSYSNVINDIYDKLPKVSANGSNFALENAQNGKLDSFGMEGNTHQDSYTGKNKYAITSAKGYTYSNSLPAVVSNNMVIDSYDLSNITFHTAGTRYLLVLLPTFELEPNTDYIINYTRSNNLTTGTAAKRFIYEVDSSNNFSLIQQYFEDKGFQAYQFTTRTTGKIAIAFGFSNNSSRSSSTVNNLMIRLATESDGTFEPYVGGQPSPSPDYPQDVKVVSGNQVVNVSGKNLFNPSNVLLNEEIQNSVVAYSSVSNIYYMKVNIGTKYNFSKKSSAKSGIIGFADEIPNTGVTTYDRTGLSGIASISKTATHKYLILQLQKDEDLSETMVEVGNTKTTYQPYHNKDYEIDLGDIELCKIGDYQDYIYKENNKWYKHSEIGKLDMSTITSWSKNTDSSFYRVGFANAYRYKKDKLLSNIFIYSTTVWENGKFGISSSGNLWISTNDNSIQIVDNLPNWLSNKNAIMYGALETPTNTEITDTTLINQLEAIETETGTNIFEVSNENNVLPSLNVKRLKELEKLS